MRWAAFCCLSAENIAEGLTKVSPKTVPAIVSRLPKDTKDSVEDIEFVLFVALSSLPRSALVAQRGRPAIRPPALQWNGGKLPDGIGQVGV